MPLVRKSTVAALLVALLVAIFGAAQPVLATGDPGGPPSGNGVDPVLYYGNKTCTDLGYQNSFKVDPPNAGTYNIPGGYTVTVTRNGSYFDWTSTLGMDAVLAKGGSNGNIFVYQPPTESFDDTNLHAPINPNNGYPYGLSHIEFCYDIEPVLTAVKTAVGTYDRTISWKLEKSVAPATHIGTVGESADSSTWTVVATKTVTLGNYKVAGSITIGNPSNKAANFSVGDVMNDGTVAVVTCPGTGNNTGTVPATGTITCSYTASPANGNATENTATITTSNPNDIGGATAKAAVSFTAKTIGDETVTVDDDRDTEGQFPKNDLSSTTTFDYDESFTCSSNQGDYTNGVDTDTYRNTATLTSANTKLSDYAKITVTCYAPIVDKTAEASHKQTYTWTIDKEADGSYSKFIGDPATNHNYTVTVDQSVDESFVVSGTITVTNPRPNAAMTVSLADVMDGTPATLSCSNPLNIAAGGSESCDYGVALGSAVDGTNVVTATFNKIDFIASADYEFGEPEIKGFAAITVTDTNEQQWKNVDGDDSWQYPKEFPCPTDKSSYVNGVYTAADYVNTATIDETGQSDTATVKLTCYGPVVAKDAKTEWQREYTWEITKAVDPSSHSGIPGDDFTSTYSVTVDQKVTDSGFISFGTISVTNPAGSPGAITVAVADEVNGSVAVVDCDVQAGNQSTLTVDPGNIESCTYSISLPDATDRTNRVRPKK